MSDREQITSDADELAQASGHQSTPVTSPLCPDSRTGGSSGCETSQMYTQLSLDPETMKRPSGLKAACAARRG